MTPAGNEFDSSSQLTSHFSFPSPSPFTRRGITGSEGGEGEDGGGREGYREGEREG